MKIRFAVPEDSSALLRIYAQYIDTPITFERTLPTEAEFAERIASITTIYPYLVWEKGGIIIGYAYAHRQMEREAYQWNAELSIYLDKTVHSNGAGTTLYQVLIELLALQGVKTVYGGVTVPNEKSERLHLGFGFQRLGTYHNTGYKNGQWHHVSWFEKAIAPYQSDPAPIRPLSQVPPQDILRILSVVE